MKFFVKDKELYFCPTAPSFQTLYFSIPVFEIAAQTEGNQTSFKVTFKQKQEQFNQFVGQILGWKPILSSNEISCEFSSDLNRDIILLEITEVLQRSFKSEFSVLHFPITARQVFDKNGKVTAR